MALKVLMLRKKKDGLAKQLAALRAKSSEFEKREAELETAINELTEESTQEEQDTVNSEVEKLEKEKGENQNSIDDLEKQIKDIEDEIKAEEEKQPKPVDKPTDTDEQRGGNTGMNIRTTFFGMTTRERDDFFAREDIKSFLGQVRTAIKEKRSLENVGLTIPEVVLPLLKQKVAETSKLLKYVTPRPVTGTARETIMGDIPEAIWTEMLATLNELTLEFNDVEVDGYMVGGFFAIPNSYLKDSDVALMSEIISALGKAIGKATDKAILYGKGTKMPLGVVTRLAQTAKPENYPATARKWVNLSESNIKTGTGKTGIALFKEIIGNTKNISNEYYDDNLVWCMSKATHMNLVTESIDKNLNAAIVAGINNQMPVVGGDIVELPFIPEGDIIVGYFGAYLLIEREGTEIASTTHARFIQNQTLFKGTARYDGKPVIAEAFMLMSLTTKAPATTVTFPTDKANESTSA